MEHISNVIATRNGLVHGLILLLTVILLVSLIPHLKSIWNIALSMTICKKFQICMSIFTCLTNGQLTQGISPWILQHSLPEHGLLGVNCQGEVYVGMTYIGYAYEDEACVSCNYCLVNGYDLPGQGLACMRMPCVGIPCKDLQSCLKSFNRNESPYSPGYSSSLLDPILPRIQLVWEYALPCLGPYTAHSKY